MEYSEEHSDYSEASNEVNDGNKNSPSQNVVDISAATYESTNGREINDGTIGVISKFCFEPYSQSPNLSHCLLTFCCLSSLQSTLNLIKSISKKLQKKEGRSFRHPLQITMSLELLCGRRSPTGRIPKASQSQQKVAV